MTPDFPGFLSWISPRAREHAARIAALKADWLPRLATALARLPFAQETPGDAPLSPEQAAVELAALPPWLFLPLDEALRIGNPEGMLPRIDTWPHELARLAGPATEREARLFVAGCSRSGFLREAAVDAIAAHPGRTALALLLARCHDWVPEVRSRALHHLKAMLPGQGEALLSLIDLVRALAVRQQPPGSDLQALLDERLTAKDLRAARWHAAEGALVSRARWATFELVARADPDRLGETCALAMQQHDPRIARWGMDKAIADLPAEAVTPLLQRALAHPHGSIRAAALRRRVQQAPAGSRPLVERSLLDDSGAVRSAAAHLLRTLFDEDAAARWRDCLDAGGAHGPAALVSLCERAGPGDMARILPWRRHEKSRLRAAALRGLVRANAPERVQYLREALVDGSPRVRRQALALCKLEPGILTGAFLDQSRRQSTHPATRASLVVAGRQLGKWPQLECLLGWLPEAASDDPAHLARELDRWLRRDTGNFSPLVPELRGRLLVLLEQARSALPTSRRERLAYILSKG